MRRSYQSSLSSDEVVAELIEFSNHNQVTRKKLQESGRGNLIYSCRKHFGSLRKAKLEAGISDKTISRFQIKSDVIEELQKINKQYGKVTQNLLRELNRSDIEYAIRVHFNGSLNEVYKEAELPIHRHDTDNTLKIHKTSLMEIAPLLGWVCETSTYQTNKGGHVMQLESPELDLHKLFRADAKTVGYWGKNWDTFTKTSRDTYVSRLCSKTVIEKMLFYITTGQTSWYLTDTYFEDNTPETDMIFLRRFFDAEGSVNLDRTTVRVHAVTGHKRVAHQIHDLLSGLGIEAKVYPLGNGYSMISIYRKNAIAKFYELKGFGLPRKAIKLESLLYNMWGSTDPTHKTKRCPHCGKFMSYNREAHVYSCKCGEGDLISR